MNFALAAKSENGVGILDLPLRLIIGQFFLSLIGGAFAGAFLAFFASIPLVGLFGDFGKLLTFMVAISVPVYFLCQAVRFARIRETAHRLRKKLLGTNGSGDAYRGVAVKNI